MTQEKPNFSGKWTLVPDPGAPKRTRGADGNEELTVTQDAKTLTVEQMSGGDMPVPIKVVYALDEAETKQMVMRSQLVTKAAWEGNRLVLSVTGANVDWKETWSLEDGRLIIATSTPGRNITLKRTYKKAGVEPHV